MNKNLEKITVDSNSEMAQKVFNMDIDLFRCLAMVTVDFLADMEDKDKMELLSFYTEKNQDMCSEFVNRIADESNNIYDQLIHFAMATVTLALNFHGCYEYLKGSVEIQDLLGDLYEEGESDEHE